jgi:hypothetical protein
MIPRTDFSDTPVLSTALILRYPYLPLESANAPATSALSPAYLSTPSRAWRQWWPPGAMPGRHVIEPGEYAVFCFNVCSTGSAVFFRSVG